MTGGLTSSVKVRRRLVIVFAGVEPVPVVLHCRRFKQEARKVAPLYGMKLAFDKSRVRSAKPGGVEVGEFVATASGDGWSTRSEIVIFGFGNINAHYAARPLAARLATGVFAQLDRILTGTLFRYLKANWRYGFFFLFPLVLLGAVTLPFAVLLAAAIQYLGAVHLVWALPLLVLLWWRSVVAVCARTHLPLVLDLWSFGYDYARGTRPEVHDMLGATISEAVERARNSDADEIVFTAHSLGAPPCIEAIASALRTNARPVLMTVGSALPAMALHPSARGLREAVRQVAETCPAWLDVQSLTDIMNFYRTHPTRSLGIEDRGNVHMMTVRFRNQLLPATYQAIKRDFFRVHRQFVLGVERPSPYSFHAILCGPERLEDIARRPGLNTDESRMRPR